MKKVVVLSLPKRKRTWGPSGGQRWALGRASARASSHTEVQCVLINRNDTTPLHTLSHHAPSPHFPNLVIRFGRSAGAMKTNARPSRGLSRSPSSTKSSRSVRAV